MKKDKGFTLIELLAVIVILAIIALIATPTILGVIEKARKGSAESSALGFIDAVEKQIAINTLDSSKTDILDGVYTVTVLTNTYGVNVKGQKPIQDKDGHESIVKIEKNQVVDYSLQIGDYVVEPKEGTASASKNGTLRTELSGSTPSATTYPVFNNGKAVYYNPTTGEACDASSAVSTTGTKSGCMKWYAFLDAGANSDKVNLILDHNTTATIKWNASGSNVAYESSNVKTAITGLGWDTSLNTRIISADEVHQIANSSSWDVKDNNTWYCLDSGVADNTNYCAKPAESSNYYWLFDNTTGCRAYGCKVEDSSNYGYWTSTPVDSDNAGSGSRVWDVTRSGGLYNCLADDTYYGVRPVITIEKSIIK